MRVYPSGQAAIVDTTDADVDQLVLEVNQARENVRALQARCHRLWSRAGRGLSPLSREQRRALTVAFRRLLAAAKGG